MAAGSAAQPILFDVGVIIIAATTLAMAAKLLKQPLLAAYILAGIIIGPSVLGIVDNTGVIQMFAELGVAFLLFVVGLELDLSRLREVRDVVLAAAFAEVGVLFALGTGLMVLWGYGLLPAIYIGLAVAFSSTAVLVKLLADTGDLDTLHGRIVLGVLLIQDILVVLALSVLATVAEPSISALVSSLVTGGGLLALAIVISNYIAPHLFATIDDSHELVFLVSIAVLFGFVGAAVESGLSTAVGGFLAGISLTAFPYNIEVAERARTMRDFFVTIFFVSLGMLISLGSIIELWLPFVVLLLLVVALKPVIVNLVATQFRYGKRTSFYAGLSLGQVSEFSMVLALAGLAMGHIDRGIFSLLTALMVASNVLTSYALKYRQTLYARAEGLLSELEHARYEEGGTELRDHIVVCGGHIKGRKILQLLEDRHEEVVVLDYDPAVISALSEWDHVTPLYGDVEDAQTLERANVRKAKAVISTVPDHDDNRYLLTYLKRHNPDAVAIMSTDDVNSALRLYEEGADYVLYPKMLAAQEAADMVEQLYEDGAILETAREAHIRELEDVVEEDILKRFEPAFVQKLKDRMNRVYDRGGR